MSPRACFGAVIALISVEARALPPGFDPSAFPDPSSLIQQTVADAVVLSTGIATDHRPYEPATPLGALPGLSFGLDLTITQVSDLLRDALTSAGLSGDDLPPALPVPRLHLQKGLGQKLSVGASWLNFRGYRVYGGDIKFAVWQPEEGPTIALRLCYSSSVLGYARAQVWNPQILISRALDFADPYMGVGYVMSAGKIEFTYEVAPGFPVTLTKAGTGSALAAFLGVQLRVPMVGLQIALEGSYSTVGMNTLGMKFGFRF